MARKFEDIPFSFNGNESLWRSPAEKDRFSEMGHWNSEKVPNGADGASGRMESRDWLRSAEVRQSTPVPSWNSMNSPVSFEPFNDYPNIWSSPSLPVTDMQSSWVQPAVIPAVPIANDFMFYAMSVRSHRIGEDSIFFLESRRGVGSVDAKDFRVRVMRKDGSYIPLSLRPDYKCQGRFICSFKPYEAGEYILTAKYLAFGDSSDVRGSPQSLHVSHRFDRRAFPTPISLIPIGTKPSAPTPNSSNKVDMKPWGLAVHPRENLIYATDRTTHSIVVMKPGGSLVRKFGSFGTGPGDLFRPCGIALDLTRDRVIVTDKDNHRVAIYGLTGNFIANFGSKGFANGQLHYPWGIAVSADGSMICVADSRNHRIQIFDGETFEFIRKYSIFESSPFEYKALFDSPRDVIFDPTGKFIYVTDFDIHALFRIDVDCTHKDVIAGPKLLQRPQGLAWDVNGNLLVADSSSHCVRVFAPDGRYIHPLNGGNTPLKSPLNVAVLAGGKKIVVDTTNFIRAI